MLLSPGHPDVYDCSCWWFAFFPPLFPASSTTIPPPPLPTTRVPVDHKKVWQFSFLFLGGGRGEEGRDGGGERASLGDNGGARRFAQLLFFFYDLLF